MRQEAIDRHVRSRPFTPVRLYLSDGSRYDVRHPEMCMITRSEVRIADHTPGAATYSEIFCDPLHVTRIEPITHDT
jgi:hypothetical protein